MECPDCKSMSIAKNGYSPAGKQKYKCMNCHKQFVENPISRMISDEKKTLIDALLLERISLRGIGRTVKVSLTWLQGYVNKKYRETPRQVNIKKRENAINIRSGRNVEFCRK